ncbi:interferon type A1/A2-like [Porphyrio hochstetteri]
MAALPTPQLRSRHGAPALLLLLTALAATATTTFACHHLRPHHDTFSWDSLQLLQAMAPSPTQSCHNLEDSSFKETFLNTSHTHRDAAIATALQILEHLSDILSSPNTPQRWDARARQHLLNNLHHSTQRLQKCQPDSRTLSKTHWFPNLLLSINRYFSSIKTFLHTHSYSACAWHQVRQEAAACFRHLDTLLRRGKRQATPALYQTQPSQMPSPRRRRGLQPNHRPHRPHQRWLSTAHTSSSHKPAPAGNRAGQR